MGGASAGRGHDDAAAEGCICGEFRNPPDLPIRSVLRFRGYRAHVEWACSTQPLTLPVCTVGDETCQLPCGPCNTRAFIYETSSASLAFTSIVHYRNTTIMSFEVRAATNVDRSRSPADRQREQCPARNICLMLCKLLCVVTHRPARALITPRKLRACLLLKSSESRYAVAAPPCRSPQTFGKCRAAADAARRAEPGVPNAQRRIADAGRGAAAARRGSRAAAAAAPRLQPRLGAEAQRRVGTAPARSWCGMILLAEDSCCTALRSSDGVACRCAYFSIESPMLYIRLVRLLQLLGLHARYQGGPTVCNGIDWRSARQLPLKACASQPDSLNS